MYVQWRTSRKQILFGQEGSCVLGNKACKMRLLGEPVGMPPKLFLDFRPSEIVSGALLEGNSESGSGDRACA